MKRTVFLLLSVILVSPLWAANEQPKMLRSYEVFKRMPVLDNGRIKPLDTFARNLLLQFSGRDAYNHKPAIEWMAKLLFAPELIKDDRVFLINNPDIATALGIDIDQHRRYSFSQLGKALPKLTELADAAKHIEKKQRSIVEEEIIRVYENVRYCGDLSNVMAFVFAHQDFTVTSLEKRQALGLGDEDERLSFLDVAVHAKEFQGIKVDEEIKAVLQNFFHWSMMYKDMPLAIIPMENEPSLWLSPWDAIAKSIKEDSTKEIMLHLQDMAASYWAGDQIHFDLSARLYLDAIERRMSVHDQKKLSTFPLELTYHQSMPFLWARIFFILAFICFIASLISPMKLWYNTAWVFIMCGFVLVFLALVARIIIMARPPVSSLYETFIFVSCISVALGMWVERMNKQWLGIVVSAVSGSAFLFIAARYNAEGDTLQMLVAVLNSNFWLATHVTTITMGYASTCVAGVLGHIWLIQAACKKNKAILDNTYQVMMVILGMALTLTFLGTNLGGIWADQSWGRFWGWDPKENGALMIVLWSAMLFHAKVSKIIGAFGMAVGTVLGVVVVMWAWFGVNLLSIGLHSYGFTSGIATSLAIYVICEIIFLLITSAFIKKND